MKMKQIECSETSAYINQTPGNHPKENTQEFDCFLNFWGGVRLGLLSLRPQVNEFLSVWFNISVLWHVLCEFESNYLLSHNKVCILKFRTNVCGKLKDSSEGRNGMCLKKER